MFSFYIIIVNIEIPNVFPGIMFWGLWIFVVKSQAILQVTRTSDMVACAVCLLNWNQSYWTIGCIQVTVTSIFSKTHVSYTLVIKGVCLSPVGWQHQPKSVLPTITQA